MKKIFAHLILPKQSNTEAWIEVGGGKLQFNPFVVNELENIAINNTFYSVGLSIACCDYEED